MVFMTRLSELIDFCLAPGRLDGGSVGLIAICGFLLIVGGVALCWRAVFFFWAFGGGGDVCTFFSGCAVCCCFVVCVFWSVFLLLWFAFALLFVPFFVLSVCSACAFFSADVRSVWFVSRLRLFRGFVFAVGIFFVVVSYFVSFVCWFVCFRYLVRCLVFCIGGCFACRVFV